MKPAHQHAFADHERSPAMNRPDQDRSSKGGPDDERALKAWLQKEIVPILDAYDHDPEQVHGSDEVRADMHRAIRSATS